MYKRSTIFLLKRFQSTVPRDPVTIIPTVYELTQDKDLTPELNPETSLVSYLKSRNLIESITDEKLFNSTIEKNLNQYKLYCGADPTAISLHLGNLLPLMVLLHFQLRGSNIVGLIGGATGQVGDPSGRKDERDIIENEKLNKNINNITNQFESFFKNGLKYANSRQFPINQRGDYQILNNFSWWKDIKMLEFLSSFGKFIRISSMISRSSIQSRLNSKEGIGFNEFTYQILQAYDFYHLFKNENVNIQIGGNDQWGNITAGIDLITKSIKNSNSYGITVPLLLTPLGEKFGKSAGNAIFIDSNLTSPYQMYQFFINVSDDLIGKLLKCFTLLPLNVIESEIIPKHKQDPGLRIGQRILAREVVDLIHGVGIGDEMAFITGFLFPTPDQPFNDEISANKLIQVFNRSGILYKYKLNNPTNDIKLSTIIAEITGKSKSEIKRLIKSQAIYIGLDRDQLNDPDDVVLFDKSHHLIDEKLMLIRIGKQNYYVTEFI